MQSAAIVHAVQILLMTARIEDWSKEAKIGWLAGWLAGRLAGWLAGLLAWLLLVGWLPVHGCLGRLLGEDDMFEAIRDVSDALEHMCS